MQLVCPDCGSFGERHCDHDEAVCDWRVCKRNACSVEIYDPRGGVYRKRAS